MTHPHPKRRFVPQAILTKSGKLKTAGTLVTTVRPVNTANTKPIMNYSRPTSNAFKKGYSKAIRLFNKYSTYKKYIFNREGNPQQKEYKEKGVIDGGCSRHMTGNKSYLTKYENYDGGFVSFKDGKGRISRKDKIKTGTLDFDDVYFYGVAKRKNKTLIEAARTMLVDSKLPSTFWEEAVNTACYMLNRALVIKPHNKTPYELIRRRPPLIDFMKPFGCHVTILNTRDYLVVIGFQTNGIVGTKDNIVAGPKDSAVDAGKKATESARPSFVNASSPSPINAAGTPASTNAFEEHPFERFSPFKNAFYLPHVPIVTPINDTGIFRNAYDDEVVEEEVDMNNVVSSYTIPDAPLTKFLKDHPKDQVIGNIETPVETRQITKINEEHGLISSVQKLRRTNHKDFQNYLFTCYLSQMEPKKPVQALKDPH
nr:ribonuclease H-like domain-containing protein [Tanacetum cinerariifolium]